MTSYISPDIHDINLFEKVNNLFNKLLTSGVTICGFDTESTHPMYDKNEVTNKYVSIIQICIQQNHGGIILEGLQSENDDSVYTCYIIPVKHLFVTYKRFPKEMLKFLKSKKIVKTGADITADQKKLLKFGDLALGGFIDLQDLARSMGNNNFSLNSLAQSYLKEGKLKSNLGNYDHELTLDQIRYSVHDAYLSLCIYLKMINKHEITIIDIGSKSNIIDKVDIIYKLDNLEIKDKADIVNKMDIKDNSEIKDKVDIKDLTYSDALDLYSYLTQKAGIFTGTSGYKYSSILNIIINGGYKPWNIYDKIIKKHLLDRSLEVLILHGNIRKMKDDKYYNISDGGSKLIISEVIEGGGIGTDEIGVMNVYSFFIKNNLFNKMSKVTYNTLMNCVRNSYKPWNNLTIEEINKLLKLVLDFLIDEKYICKMDEGIYCKMMDGGKDLFAIKVKESIYRCIPKTGIKIKSLVNFVDTSTEALIKDKILRLERIETHIIEFLESGVLHEDDGIIYLLL